MITIEAALASHRFLKDIERPYLEDLAQCARVVDFESGNFILRQGAPATEFYLIRSGKVTVELFSSEGGPVVLRTLGEGDVLGWSWLIPPYHWRFDARAIEPTQAIALNAKILKATLENFPKFGYEILRRFIGVIVDRLEAEQLKLLNLYGAHS